MKQMAATLFLLALAACGGEAAPVGPQTDVQACERLANDDPSVRAAINRSIGNQRFVGEDQDQIQAMKRSATLSCLRARGVLQRGHVEQPDA